MTRLTVPNKLFSHTEHLDKEFENVYKKIKATTDTITLTPGPAGAAGAAGAAGPAGATGAAGQGVPTGGAAGELLAKIDATNYNTEWIAPFTMPALDDLTDVDAPTPSDGQVLTWDDGSSSWIPTTLAIIATLISMAVGQGEGAAITDMLSNFSMTIAVT